MEQYLHSVSSLCVCEGCGVVLSFVRRAVQSNFSYCLLSTVVLPYYKEDQALTILQEKKDQQRPIDNQDREVIYKRHQVSQMPADAWGDIWPKLHQQLQHVEVKQPNSIPALLYPTLETTVVWGMRLALAVCLYHWIDKKLHPIYKLPNPQDRPVIRRPTLSTSGSMDLGSLGQSRYALTFILVQLFRCERLELTVMGHRLSLRALLTVE